jgi:hypothetical protein
MSAHPTGLFYRDSIRSQKASLVIEGECELGVTASLYEARDTLEGK